MKRFRPATGLFFLVTQFKQATSLSDVDMRTGQLSWRLRGKNCILLSCQAKQRRSWTWSKMWIAWSNITDSVKLQKLMDNTKLVTYVAIRLAWRLKSDALRVWIWHRQTFYCLLAPLQAFVKWHQSREETILEGDKCASTWRKFFFFELVFSLSLSWGISACLWPKGFLNTSELTVRCHFVVMKWHYLHCSEVWVGTYVTGTTSKFKKRSSVHGRHILVPMFWNVAFEYVFLKCGDCGG